MLDRMYTGKDFGRRGAMLSAKMLRFQRSFTHVHECSVCGIRWQHNPFDFIDYTKAHTCPRCNALQYVKLAEKTPLYKIPVWTGCEDREPFLSGAPDKRKVDRNTLDSSV